MKKCILCGKLFQPKTNAQKVCSDVHYRACDVCGKLFEITRPSDSRRCCSKECTVIKRERTQLERTGYSHALQNPASQRKAKLTTLERFGVEHAAQSDKVKTAVKEHFNTKYGVDSPFQMSDFWDKAKQTNLAKYGTEYAIQNKQVQQKSQTTCQNKYGYPHSIQSKTIKERVEAVCLERYGVPYPCMSDQCRESSASVISKINLHVANLIESSTTLQCELDKIKIDRFSYDIHIKDTNILLEVDPTYTHNAVGNHWTHQGIDKRYHINKTLLAAKHGYRCIHIFDWDDLEKIVKMLSPKQSIYARKCRIDVMPTAEVSQLEIDNHLQQTCRGQKVCLGLYYGEIPVQVMTFGAPRYNRNYQWELLRLCTDYRYKVVGGSERLFTKFLGYYNPKSIISYCDLSKFSGDVYSRLGFTLHHNTEPNKVWSRGSSKVTNNLLMSRGYDQLFNTNYGKGTSNEQLMLENGWLPVYDCGQAAYLWTS